VKTCHKLEIATVATATKLVINWKLSLFQSQLYRCFGPYIITVLIITLHSLSSNFVAFLQEFLESLEAQSRGPPTLIHTQLPHDFRPQTTPFGRQHLGQSQHTQDSVRVLQEYSPNSIIMTQRHPNARGPRDGRSTSREERSRRRSSSGSTSRNPGSTVAASSESTSRNSENVAPAASTAAPAASTGGSSAASAAASHATTDASSLNSSENDKRLIAKQNKMLAKYKKDLEEANAKLKGSDNWMLYGYSGKQVTIGQCSKPLLKLIEDAVKKRGWRMAKFFPQTPQHQQAYVRAVVMRDLAEQYSAWPETKEDQERFLGKLHNVVANKLNVKRCYVVQRLKEAMHIWYNKNKGKMPTEAMIAGAATRTLDLTNEDHLKWMTYYWSKLLARAAGSNTIWNKDIHLFETVTTSKVRTGPFTGQETIPPSTEAFVVAVLANYGKAWEHYFKACDDFQPRPVIVDAKKAKETANDADDAADDDEPKYVGGPEFKPRWTKNDNGADPEGGWTKEGLDFFVNMISGINRERNGNRAAIDEFETQVIKQLREDNGVHVDTLEEYRNAKRLKGKNGAQKERVDLCNVDRAFLDGIAALTQDYNPWDNAMDEASDDEEVYRNAVERAAV